MRFWASFFENLKKPKTVKNIFWQFWIFLKPQQLFNFKDVSQSKKNWTSWRNLEFSSTHRSFQRLLPSSFHKFVFEGSFWNDFSIKQMNLYAFPVTRSAPTFPPHMNNDSWNLSFMINSVSKKREGKNVNFHILQPQPTYTAPDLLNVSNKCVKFNGKVSFTASNASQNSLFFSFFCFVLKQFHWKL